LGKLGEEKKRKRNVWRKKGYTDFVFFFFFKNPNISMKVEKKKIIRNMGRKLN